MDYEKEYKKIVGKIKNAYLHALTDSTKAVLEEIIPELAESEDEKVRKELICFLETEIPQCNARDKYIAWLEKQGKKQERSEEEEAVLDALIRRLKGEDIHVSPHLAVECLESLKERIGGKV